ncbi:hypothetical protein SGLAM104S_00739 [Streptomyces glaucescens]
MAADILAYGTDEVPVGQDQAQHVELARDVAVRFNQRRGTRSWCLGATSPGVAARVMNLQEPTSKMGSKPTMSGRGSSTCWTSRDVVRKKVMWRRDRQRAGRRLCGGGGRGVANLVEILAACTGGNPEALKRCRPSLYGALRGHGRGRGRGSEARAAEAQGTVRGSRLCGGGAAGWCGQGGDGRADWWMPVRLRDRAAAFSRYAGRGGGRGERGAVGARAGGEARCEVLAHRDLAAELVRPATSGMGRSVRSRSFCAAARRWSRSQRGRGAVSAVKWRAKLRGDMPAWAARSATVSGSCR